jgi:hypothetical protein
MNQNATIPAPEGNKHEPRTREQLDAARFGTIGFDLYKAVVLAESERLFQNRKA